MRVSLMTSQEREVSQSYTSTNDTIWTGILCIYLDFLKIKTSAEVFSKWFLMKYKLYFRVYFLRTWPLMNNWVKVAMDNVGGFCVIWITSSKVRIHNFWTLYQHNYAEYKEYILYATSEWGYCQYQIHVCIVSDLSIRTENNHVLWILKVLFKVVIQVMDLKLRKRKRTHSRIGDFNVSKKLF